MDELIVTWLIDYNNRQKVIYDREVISNLHLTPLYKDPMFDKHIFTIILPKFLFY